MKESNIVILKRLQNEILVGDGAIGTMLYAKGVSLDSNFEHLNLVRPNLVAGLADEFALEGRGIKDSYCMRT